MGGSHGGHGGNMDKESPAFARMYQVGGNMKLLRMHIIKMKLSYVIEMKLPCMPCYTFFDTHCCYPPSYSLLLPPLFAQVQTLWDEYMAESAANHARRNPLDTLVVIAGVGHVAGRVGIPDRIHRRMGGGYSGSNKPFVVVPQQVHPVITIVINYRLLLL